MSNTEKIVLQTEITSQKRALTAMANQANMRIQRGKRLLSEIQSGKIQIMDVKDEVLKAQADALGARDTIADIDKWIQREIERDEVASQDPQLIASYTKLMEQACEKRNFEGILKELDEVLDGLEAIIEAKSPPKEKWHSPRPNPLEEHEDGESSDSVSEKSSAPMTDESPAKDESDPIDSSEIIGEKSGETETPLMTSNHVTQSKKSKKTQKNKKGQGNLSEHETDMTELKENMRLMMQAMQQLQINSNSTVQHLQHSVATIQNDFAVLNKKINAIQKKQTEKKTQASEEKGGDIDKLRSQSDLKDMGTTQVSTITESYSEETMFRAVKTKEGKTVYVPITKPPPSESKASDSEHTIGHKKSEHEVSHNEKPTPEKVEKLEHQIQSTDVGHDKTVATTGSVPKQEWKKMETAPFTLPHFSGTDSYEYEEWRTMFDRLYGDDPELDDLSKLFQLKAHLSDNAKILVSSVKTLPQNYAVALKILDENFKKDVKPLERLHYEFENFQIHQKDYEAILLDVNTVAGILFQIKNAGGPINIPAIYLRFVAKLPPKLQRKMMEKTQSVTYTS